MAYAIKIWQYLIIVQYMNNRMPEETAGWKTQEDVL